MRQLNIDPEFRDKIPPLSDDEFSKLEENILSDGEVREPLVIWHNTIIDGHHRYKIIQKHPEIPFRVKQMDFTDKWAAIVWMCRNQLGRRNITDEQKTALIGEAYKAQKMSVGAQIGNENAKKQCGQNDAIVLCGDKPTRTRDSIAKQFGVGTKTVERSEHFLDGLNEADKVSPGIKEAVLTGAVKGPKNIISEIRNAQDEKKKEAVEAIKKGDTKKAKAILRPIQNTEPEHEAGPFTVAEFQELINAAVKALDSSLKQHLVLVHREMLYTEQGRAAAMEALDSGIGVIEKYKDMVRMVKENGAEN